MTTIPQPPARSTKQTRYPLAMVSVARTMYGDGDTWTPTQIMRYLRSEYDAPTLCIETIREWVIPGFDEYRRAQQREAHRKRMGSRTKPTPELAAASERWARLVALRDEGMSYRSLSVVVKVDYGIAIDQEVIRYAFNSGKNRKVLERLAD